MHFPVGLAICQTIHVGDLPGVTAVMVNDVEMWDPFSKIGLDSVDTGVHQSMDQTDIPLASFGIGEVDNSHSRLPLVPNISTPLKRPRTLTIARHFR